MLTNLINRPCTIRQRATSGYDDYGNETDTLTDTATVCEFQQQQRSENEDELAAVKWRVFLPTGTSISSGDQLVVDGTAYEVDGEPWDVRNPRTKTGSHIEATVIRVAGNDG